MQTKIEHLLDIDQQMILRKKLQKRQEAEHYFFIDIVGSCNLKCPSCAIGRIVGKKPTGHMPIDYFKKVIKKIKADSKGKAIFIDLYNWTEPFLHPDVDKFIKILNDNNIGSGLSSNLSINRDYKSLIKENPDYIRVSLSGFKQETYGKSHSNGNINLVKSNLYRLRYLIDQYGTDTIVQVGFHIYRSNFPTNFLKIAELCDELGFIFAPTLATVMQVEDVMKDMELKNDVFDPSLAKILVLTPLEWKEAFDQGKILSDCQYRSSRTAINFDGSVPQCCAVYDKEYNIAPNFLETTPLQLKKLKYENTICAGCMSNNLHMMYTGEPSQSLERSATKILGNLYEQWLEIEKNMTNFDLAYINNKFVSLQSLYDEAIISLQHIANDLDTPIKLFSSILKHWPAFGEGYFQMSKLNVLNNDLETAQQNIQRAVELDPSNKNYEVERMKIETLGR